MRNPIVLYARREDPNRPELLGLAEAWGTAGAVFPEDPENLRAAVNHGCRILVVSVRGGDAEDFLDSLRATPFDFRLLLLLPDPTPEESPDLLDAAYAQDPWLVLRGKRGLEMLPDILAAMVRSPLWRPEEAVRLNRLDTRAPADGNAD